MEKLVPRYMLDRENSLWKIWDTKNHEFLKGIENSDKSMIEGKCKDLNEKAIDK